MRFLHAVLLLTLSVPMLGGCQDKAPESAQLSEAMPNLPLPPLASFISRSGSPDALQLNLRSGMVPDSLAAYYRAILSQGEWRLVSDNRSRDGVVTLYAERNGPPLWVTIRQDTISSGSLLTLGGAKVKNVRDTGSARDTTPPS